MSWTAARGGYELFFNRDELNTRAAEFAPEVSTRKGVEYIAPTDGHHRGTWLLANEAGLTICLLNDYGHAWRPATGRARYSRGHIVLGCAASRDQAAVIAAVEAQPLDCVAPFRIVALSPGEGPLVLHWQGLRLVQTRAELLAPPLTSSSFATDTVIAHRTRQFSFMVRSALAPDSVELAAFHRQHDRRAGAQSVLMQRPDACTRSISHVRVTDREVRMTYEAVGWTDDGPVLAAPISLSLHRRERVTKAA